MSFTYRFKILTLILTLCVGFTFAAFAKSSKAPFVVVIDAGHGGKDVGAVDNGVKEKDINLGVALQLGEMLKKKMKDVKVVYTRDNDTYLTLQQRADKANRSKGNLFISIHTNSLDQNNPKRQSVEGASVYVLGLHKDDNNMKVAQRENAVIKLEDNFNEKYEGFDPQRDESYIIFEMAQKKNLSNSIKFAEHAEKMLQSEAGRKGRGVHQAGFWVLWATAMPGALVEVDFICNPKSAEFISSSEGQKKLATSLFKAIQNYRKDLKLAEKQPKKTTTIVDQEGAVTLAESTKSTRITTDVPKVKASKSGSSKRRRRSQSARRISDARNYETDFIVINTHSDKKLIGGLVVENDVPVIAQANTDDKAKGEKQKKAKKNRKDRKVKPQKNKKSESEVRIVNGHKVVVGNDTRSGNVRVTAKENSEQARKGSRARNSKNETTASREVQLKPAEETVRTQENLSSDIKKKQESTEQKKTSKARERSIASMGSTKHNKSKSEQETIVSDGSAEKKVKTAFSKQNERKGTDISPDSRLNRRSRNHR